MSDPISLEEAFAIFRAGTISADEASRAMSLLVKIGENMEKKPTERQLRRLRELLDHPASADKEMTEERWRSILASSGAAGAVISNWKAAIDKYEKGL